MIVSISGLPGSGKSTVGELLSSKLKFEYYDVGRIRRDMAAKRKMTLAQFNAWSETDPASDNEVDEYQRALGKNSKDIVLVSRLGWHFVPSSKKVFLKVDPREAARRIMNDSTRGEQERVTSIGEAMKKIEQRNASDQKRYKQYYGIDPYNDAHYDLVIDTSDKSPQEIADEIIKTFGLKRK